jgi:hypothetical protein
VSFVAAGGRDSVYFLLVVPLPDEFVELPGGVDAFLFPEAYFEVFEGDRRAKSGDEEF